MVIRLQASRIWPGAASPEQGLLGIVVLSPQGQEKPAPPPTHNIGQWYWVCEAPAR